MPLLQDDLHGTMLIQTLWGGVMGYICNGQCNILAIGGLNIPQWLGIIELAITIYSFFKIHPTGSVLPKPTSSVTLEGSSNITSFRIKYGQVWANILLNSRYIHTSCSSVVKDLISIEEGQHFGCQWSIKYCQFTCVRIWYQHYRLSLTIWNTTQTNKELEETKQNHTTMNVYFGMQHWISIIGRIRATQSGYYKLYYTTFRR